MKRKFGLISAAVLGLIAVSGQLAASGTGVVPALSTTTVLLIAASDPPQYAPRCKYKMDGAGNCLSPAYYKCLNAWGKCAKACDYKSPCNDRCRKKYEGTCGD